VVPHRARFTRRAECARCCADLAKAVRRVDPTITLVRVRHLVQFDQAVLMIGGSFVDQLQIHHAAPAIISLTLVDVTAKVLTERTFQTQLEHVRIDMAAVLGTEHNRGYLDELGWTGGTHSGALSNVTTVNAIHRNPSMVNFAVRPCVINAAVMMSPHNTAVTHPSGYKILQRCSALRTGRSQ